MKKSRVFFLFFAVSGIVAASQDVGIQVFGPGRIGAADVSNGILPDSMFVAEIPQDNHVVGARIGSNAPTSGKAWSESETILSGNALQIDLWRSFRPCAECKLERYGEQGDGGYAMCKLFNSTQYPVKGIYSYGVEHYDQWSADVHSVFPEAHVFQYDCTVDQGMPGARFFRECVDGSPFVDSPKPARSVGEQLKTNGHQDLPEGSLIMKMDVEDSEWGGIDHMTRAEMRLFRQIVVEYHDIDRPSQIVEKTRLVQKLLDAGFAVVHAHGNNWGALARVEQPCLAVGFFPVVIEVTMR